MGYACFVESEKGICQIFGERVELANTPEPLIFLSVLDYFGEVGRDGLENEDLGVGKIFPLLAEAGSNGIVLGKGIEVGGVEFGDFLE